MLVDDDERSIEHTIYRHDQHSHVDKDVSRALSLSFE